MENTPHSESFDQRWKDEVEWKTRFSNKLFCITFLICNPASAIAFYLAGDPFFYDLIRFHGISSVIILFYILLHYKKIISGQQLSFYTFVTLILFYAYLLAQPHLSYTQSCLNLTLAIIFAGLVIRWPRRYAITCSVLSVVAYTFSIQFGSDISLRQFFEEGGIFVIVSHLLFPVFNKLSYGKEKREFFFRYTLEQQNNKLEEQKAIAESATKAKSDFLSMMSHEIRTPLNGIVGMVHLLMKDDGPREQSKELLQTLKFSADHLMAVLNEVLDFNKINSNHVTLDPQPFDPVPLFESLERTFIPRANEKGIDLIFDIDADLPARLVGDKVRLNQIVTNLVHNAIKFTSKGMVRFVLTETTRNDKFICLDFAVIDTGIGIPASEQAAVFENFTQVKGKPQKENTGTGLGLAICKELLALFGSEMRLRSEEGKGSTFSFSLKLPYILKVEEKSDTSEIRNTEQMYPGIRVLVADDNQVNVVLATQLLKRKSIVFDIASNGKQAYELFLKERYDMILMDLRMPVMDGFESTTLIRQIDQQVPIIALTASAFENEKERVLRSGFSGYLTKPFIPDDFYNYILPFIDRQLSKPV